MTTKNKIEKVLCGLAIDNGVEGICAFINELSAVPLVVSGNFDLDKIEVQAQKIANETGVSVTLCEFTVRRDIKTVNPYRQGEH